MPSNDVPNVLTSVVDIGRGTEIRKRKRYDETFKRDAVRILLESGKPVATVALALAIDRTLLQKWRKKFDDEFATKPTNSLPNIVSTSEFLSLKREFESIKEMVDQLRLIVKKVLSCKYEDPQ